MPGEDLQHLHCRGLSGRCPVERSVLSHASLSHPLLITVAERCPSVRILACQLVYADNVAVVDDAMEATSLMRQYMEADL
eukprot:314138-Hanusia_phi.AAC.1